MKNIIYFVFLLPCIVFSQIQVSEIDFQLPRDDYPQKGFMKVGEEEYFIEQGNEGTKVSLVQGDVLEFVHELKFRPSDSPLEYFSSFYEKSNSGLIYEGPILNEFYRDYIYMVNVVTGVLKEVVNLKAYQFRYISEFYKGDNFFFINALGNEWAQQLRIDRNTGLTDTLNNDGLVVGSVQYYLSNDSTQLLYHDLETNQKSVRPYQFSKIEFIMRHASDSSSRLIIKDEEGLHLLKTDETIQTLNCNLPDGSQLRYLSDNRLAYTTINDYDLELSVVNLENCLTVFFKPFFDRSNSTSFSTYTDDQLFGEYFIFGFSNEWQGDGEFYLFDIAANEASLIDIPIDIPLLDRSVRYEDNFYFLTSNHLHYIGDRPELYRINLSTYKSERIGNQDIFQAWRIVIGEAQADKELNVYYRVEETATLAQIDDEQQGFTMIEQFDLIKNQGIHRNIYADLWVDDKYFFTANESIYVTANDATTKILDINLNIETSSAYIRNGGFVYVLTELDSAYYAIKINIENLSYTKILLPFIDFIGYQLATTDNAIVTTRGFFDTETEEYIEIEDLGLTNGVLEHQSGNNILFRTVLGPKDVYLINSVSREVIPTEVDPSDWYIGRFPDDAGGFYMLKRFAGIITLMFLDEEGKLTEIYDGIDDRYVRDQFDGQTKSLIFGGNEEMTVISINDGEVWETTVPGEELFYSQDIFWQESDEISIIERYNGTNYSTYAFAFETDLLNVTPTGRDDRLIMVMAEETHAVLVYKNDQQVLSFENFDYVTGSLEKVSEFSSVEDYAKVGVPFKIGKSKYLISFNDGIHGKEPWVYNTATDQFQLLKDMYQGIGFSNIRDFTVNPQNQEVYFSAVKNQGDRQLFKLDTLLTATQEPKVTLRSELKITPIPAQDYIRLDKDLENVSILTIDGKLISSLGPGLKNSKINTSYLMDGMYLLRARLNNNQIEVGRFIIKR